MLHKLLACAVLIFFPSSPSLAQEPKRPIPAMRAISTIDFGYLPSLLARSKGFFVQEGLDFNLLVVSVRVSLPALMSRQIHFAAAGSSMPAALKGAPLKAIYYTYKTSTFQLIVRPEVATPQQLKQAVDLAATKSLRTTRKEVMSNLTEATRSTAQRNSLDAEGR